MSARSVVFNILARDEASPVFGRVAKSAESASSGVAKVDTEGSHHVRNFGLAVAGVATAAVAFGKSSVTAFEDTARGSLGLQRVMGGSIEDASRLKFASHELGIGTDVLSVAMKKLSVNIMAGSGTSKTFTADTAKLHAAQQHLADVETVLAGKHKQTAGDAITLRKAHESVTAAAEKLAGATTSLGMKMTDANGHLLSTHEVLLKLADRFKEMPNGAEKTALAVKAFGKAGLGMIPLLNKGSEGVRELEHESDRLGLTLSTKSVDAMKKNTMNQRELNAAWEGAKVKLGGALMPAVTKFSSFLVSNVIPAVTGVIAFTDKYSGVILPLVGVLGTMLAVHKAMSIAMDVYKGSAMLVAGVTKAWAAVQWVLNAALDANPIGLIVIAIVALGVAIYEIYKHWNVIWPAIKAVTETVVHAVSTAFHWVGDEIGKVVGAIGGSIGKAVGFIAGLPGRAFSALSSLASGLANLISRAFMGWLNIQISILSSIVGFVAGVPGRIGGALSGLGGVVWRLGSDAWNGFLRITGSLANSAIGFVSGIPGRILGALGNLGGLLFDAGRNVIQGLLNGITSMIGSVGNAISGVAHTIRNYLPFSPAKVGPLSGSGSPETAGVKIGSMLAVGMRRSGGMVHAAAGDLAAMAATGAVVSVGAQGGQSLASVAGGRGGGGGGPTVNVYGPVYGGPAGRRELAMMIRDELLAAGRSTGVKVGLG